LIFNILKKNKQIFIYFFVGLINNVLNYSTYLLVLFVSSFPVISSFFGFCVGLVSNFFLNRKFTFKVRISFKKKFLKYILVQLFVLVVQLMVLKLFLIFEFDQRFAQIPAIITSGILNYVLLKLYIFKL
jgi:putative flippase GtrA